MKISFAILTYVLFLAVKCSFGAIDAKPVSATLKADSAAAAPKTADVIGVITAEGGLYDSTEETIFEEEASPASAPSLSTGKKDSLKTAQLPAHLNTDSSLSRQRNFPSPAPISVSEPDKQVGTSTAEVQPTIEAVRSINFARNLKEYRSPKLAMLFSLLVPGSGQAYAQNYPWTAAFALLEVGIIGTAIAFNIKGQKATKKAEQYADAHYDTSLYATYHDSLRQYFKRFYYKDSTGTAVEKSLDSIMEVIYGSGDPLAAFNAEVRNHSKDYYSYIEGDVSSPFIRGWTDCTPPIGSILTETGRDSGEVFGVGTDTFTVSHRSGENHLIARGHIDISTMDDKDTVKQVYGYGHSDFRDAFSALQSTARGYYNTRTNMMFVLILNHIVSALDAGLVAKQHNDRLLGKMTWLDRIRLEQRVLTVGNEQLPSYALQVKF